MSALAPFFLILTRLFSLFFSLFGHFNAIFFLDLSHGLLALIKGRLELSLSFDRLFSEANEGSLDINIILGGSLKELGMDALAKLFSLFARNRPLLLQIGLIRKHHEGKTFRCADHRFGEEGLTPGWQVVEGPGIGDIVDKKGAVGPAVECRTK